jgi:hypothetical protein
MSVTAEMPGEDTELRDQPREAEEAMTGEELEAYNATGEVPEPYFDPVRGIDEAQDLHGE